MFVLTSKISIGGISFNRVNEVVIVKDSKKLEDTATIKIPTTARLERIGDYISEVETAKTFSVGDEIIIQLGYDDNNREEFRGFVKQINPNTPLEIECEDETFILKRKNLKASWRSITLKKLLEFIVKDTGITLIDNLPTMTFTHFYLKNVSAAKALQKLKDEYGLTIYFQSWKKLFVGIANENDGTIVKYEFGFNIIDSKLKWIDEADVALQIKAVNIKPNNTRIEAKVGDESGEKRTLFFYDLPDKATLKERAKEEIQKYRYSGYRGYIDTFLLPDASVGNVAQVKDLNFSERDGEYLIKKVTTKYGEGGGRRKVELGIKLS